MINDANLKFTGSLNMRRTTDTIILHHAAASKCTVEDVHRWHMANGWSGIGYHYFIRKDGSVWRGRPEGTVGAHAGSKNGYNNHSIGICFEGNYDAETMPDKQYNAGVELVRDILTRYPGCAILGHRNVTATGCPGALFPFEKMKGDILMSIQDTTVKIGGQETAAKLIDGVTYVPLREFVEKVKSAPAVTWTKEDGAGVELK
jgi:N-acetyl-anhydromuramyl-L-alanine amidase AmpD